MFPLSSLTNRPWKYATAVVLFAAVYFGTAWLGLGNWASIMIITPFLLAWIAKPKPGKHPPRILEAVISIAVAVVSLQIILNRSSPGGATPPEAGLLIPVFISSFIWTTLRLGERGVTTAVFLTWVEVLWNTHRGVRSLVQANPDLSFLMVQAS